MDEMGLQWKKMSHRTYIMWEEKSAPGFKAFKDRFTPLLWAKLTGDCKLKPVLVYHTENRLPLTLSVPQNVCNVVTKVKISIFH